MDVVDQRLESLEKQIDKHSLQIDAIGGRVNKLESASYLLKEQLKLIEKINNTMDVVSKEQTQGNAIIYRVELSLNAISEKQVKLETELATLKEQRDKDHLEKPLAWVGQIVWIVVSSIIAFLLGKFGL